MHHGTVELPVKAPEGAHRATSGHEAADNLGALPGEYRRLAANEVEAGHADAWQDGPPVQLHRTNLNQKAVDHVRCRPLLLHRPAAQISSKTMSSR